MTNILFIGNSFTARNDLPGLLVELAGSAPEPTAVTTDAVLANGASLRQHWNAGRAIEKIQTNTWYYVVLQEQSTLPIKNAARFHENVRLFVDAIRQNGAQPVLYLTWARQRALETQTALTEATTAIAHETGALVAPVGRVWQAVLTQYPHLVLYDKDGSHPSPAGSYLAACVFYRTVFGKSPLGLVVPERLKLPSQAGLELQQATSEMDFGL